MVSTRTLTKIAAYGAVASISGVMFLRHKIQSRIRSNDYFTEAMKTLQTSPGAIKLLGEKIKDTGFDLSDEKRNNCDGQTAHFEVLVRGTKDKGTMYFWSTRHESGWNLDRLELEVKSEADKRYIIKKQETSSSSDPEF